MKNIIVCESKEKVCCSCLGAGIDCEKGYAWIFCTIRSEYEELFDGDCGETMGCNNFMRRA